MGVNRTITVQILGDYTGNPGLSVPTATIAARWVQQFLTGTGSGQSNLCYDSYQRTLAASASEQLDLTALVDPLGQALAFATVKAIYLAANAANPGDITFGAAAANPFLGPLGGTTPTLALRPGGVTLLVAPQTGWTVSGTAKLLKAAAAAAAGTYYYDIALLGA
jgi:hypothetical protein